MSDKNRIKRLKGYLDEISDFLIPKQIFTSSEHQKNMIIAEINKLKSNKDSLASWTGFKKCLIPELNDCHALAGDDFCMNAFLCKEAQDVVDKMSYKKD